jgi:pimeloyl-ACP methyl ester carboxylesterase
MRCIPYFYCVETKTLLFNNASIAYYCFGSGPKILFCFHGFGESGEHFAFLAPALKNEFTVFCLDMPHHGKTNWQDGVEGFAVTELWRMMQTLLPNEHSRFSLLGYSMGGRVAMQLLQTIPNRIEQLVLIAPDGLIMNFWYWLGTQTWGGNRILKYTMQKPGWFLRVLQLGRRLNIVNSSILRFVDAFLQEENVRLRLYRIWTTMRQFKPAIPLVKRAIAEHQIAVSVFAGQHDKIILAPTVKSFCDALGSNGQFTQIDAGHLLLKDHFADLYAKKLLEN